MISVYSVAQIRAVESQEISKRGEASLMKQAAAELASTAVAMLADKPGPEPAFVIALIGPGNNGGDGLYALAQLQEQGISTLALQYAEQVHSDAAAAYQSAGGTLTDFTDGQGELANASLIIDALYGLGYRAGSPLPSLPANARIVACDVPSGLNPETGVAEDNVLRAERTVTFGAMKSGLLTIDAPLVTGDITVADLNFDFSSVTPETHLVDEAAARELLDQHRSWRDAGRHKYQRGVLGLIAGSDLYPGAAQLTAKAAVNCGIGLLRTHVPESVRPLVAASVPESVPMDDEQIKEALSSSRRHLHGKGAKISAWAIGPGLDGRTPPTGVIAEVFASRQPAVIDASGLEVVPTGPSEQPRVLTPHAKELRMLLGRAGVKVTPDEIAQDPIRWTRWAALAYNAVVLLKGPTSYIVAPNGTSLVVSHSAPQLATAGSGDVLTGILGYLLADSSLTGTQGLRTVPNRRIMELAACAAIIHGHLGRVTAEDGTVSASRLIDNLPGVMKRFGF
ncbi:NAD(P)H-hydrate dehydratase [Glutamicibacter sp. JL.03c]|uniref:NAD(P)H-hydrate dehydratase n=1 Tax=Glutamicibacter sp. JL.03c TaxID=2984842 RepID=UPI0021F6B32C|nr:NAD(P)H-hydrate dehydratase [Glutamicibacter sp. JL.03c]UYQ76549.1 NAD(P)H-hydrate dehydratase [Glutamicibacter sp. JL.03c]